MNFQKIICFVFLLIAFNGVYGQRIRRTNKFNSYKDHVHEFGYAINLSYLRYEKSVAPQLHLHYTRYLTQYFSLGLGYSGIYDSHYHNTLNLETSFRLNQLIFSLKPGVVIKSRKGETVCLYSIGFESNYEFEISDAVHVGPMAEIDIVQDDINYLLGFHMGLTF